MNILVTGASGFIGFSLIKQLISDKYLKIYAVDNLNDYYSVSLKRKRTAQLEHERLIFFNNDISDLLNIKKLNSIDCVIHLAAQPGIRVSPDKYYKYYEDNINGFNEILNFCYKQNVKKLIYASSSSVYSGLSNSKFSEDMNLPKANNIYGLTKQFNEFQAKQAHIDYGIDSVGLRFFTVYGPWGRPDMAYFSFLKKILNHEELLIFNSLSSKRDMTYIDDIVNGIISSIRFIMKADGFHVYNLGNEDPVSLEKMIKIIENTVCIKPSLKIVKLKNEIAFTCSDNSNSLKDLKYAPKTSIEDGMLRFINWYMKYNDI